MTITRSRPITNHQRATTGPWPLAPGPRSLILTILAALTLTGRLYAQELPLSATPQGVVFSFLTETSSALDTINRNAFRMRLAGEMARQDPNRFKGTVALGTRIRIDSIPNLSATDDGLNHVVAYVTLETGIDREDVSIFCVGDSIWRIEALRSFPTKSQQTQLRQSLRNIDTTAASRKLLRDDLQRLLLSDDSLSSLLRRYLDDLSKLIEPLGKGRRWGAFALRDVDFAHLDEYRELDDDIAPADLIFYTVDRGAIERLKRDLGLRRVERDKRYPGIVLLTAGMIEQGSYGYLYSSDPRSLPPVSSSEYIVLKPISPGWWLFKRVKR